MKRNKIILIICMLFCLILTGCNKVNNMDITSIVDLIQEENSSINMYRDGYSYYLPRNMQVEDYTLYNEVLSNGKYNFYMYIDLVSYYNKKYIKYIPDDTLYYSKEIDIDDKHGYIEINEKDSKYLIEIMYNYAKIEIMVDKEDINETLVYCVNILKSVKYNDILIENLLSSDVLNGAEEDYNIFNTTSSDSNYLNYDNEYKGEVEDKEIHDSDLLN